MPLEGLIYKGHTYFNLPIYWQICFRLFQSGFYYLLARISHSLIQSIYPSIHIHVVHQRTRRSTCFDSGANKQRENITFVPHHVSYVCYVSWPSFTDGTSSRRMSFTHRRRRRPSRQVDSFGCSEEEESNRDKWKRNFLSFEPKSLVFKFIPWE